MNYLPSQTHNLLSDERIAAVLAQPDLITCPICDEEALPAIIVTCRDCDKDGCARHMRQCKGCLEFVCENCWTKDFMCKSCQGEENNVSQ